MPQRYVENERDENIIYEKMENLETRENSIRKRKKKMAKTAAKKRYDSKGRVLNKGEQERTEGRYSFRFKDENGKDKYVYANDLPQLRQEEKRIQIKQDKNIKISEGNKNMADWVTTWLESVKPKVRVTTFSGYSDNRRLHILSDRISSMKVEDIYKADVQEFYKRLVD